MSKIVNRTLKRRERLLEILLDLLESPREISLEKLAKNHRVSKDTIRRDLKELEKYICKERKYFEINWGKVNVYFQENIAPIHEDLQMYLVIALKQMEVFSKDEEGVAAYRKLLRFVEKSMNESDQESFRHYSSHIYISNYAYPLNRHFFYQQVTLVLQAIRNGQMISVMKDRKRRYLDPFCIYFAKGTFYLMAEEYGFVTEGKRRILLKEKELRHFRFDRLSKWKKEHYESPLEVAKKKKRAQKYISMMWEAEGFQKEPFTLELIVYDKKVWSRLQEREWTKHQQFLEVVDNTEGIGRLYFDGITSEQEIKKWILGWGSAVQVVNPSWLRKEIKIELKKMLKRYNK